MKMKRTTLAHKFEEAFRETSDRPVTLGEISLALDILKKAKVQSPSVFTKLAPLIAELLPVSVTELLTKVDAEFDSLSRLDSPESVTPNQDVWDAVVNLQQTLK